MTTTETSQSRFDGLKLGLALLFITAGIGAYYYFADQYILLYRVLALVGVAAFAVVLVYQTEFGKRTWQYMQDARTELRKVIWPTRTETAQTTLVVAIVVIAVGLFLWLLDLFFGWAIRTLFLSL